MAQGVALSEWQIETIRATWLLTRNGSHAARMAGCNQATANRYIKEHREELTQLANEKNPDLVDVLKVVALDVLSHAIDKPKLDAASFAQLLTGFGIMVDKLQLLSGQPTGRNEFTVKVRGLAEQMAGEMGLDPDEVIAEAERILAGAM